MTDIEMILLILLILVIGLLVLTLYKISNQQFKQNKEIEDNVRKIDELSKEAIGLTNTIKERGNNFMTQISLQSKHFQETLEDQVKKYKEITDLTNKSLERNSKNFYSRTDKAMVKLSKFQKRLEIVQQEAITTKGKGLLGEAIARNIFNIVFGEETHGNLWFEPKNTPE